MVCRPRTVNRRLLATTILILVPLFAFADAPCVNYGSYLHWLGTADLNDWSYDLDVEGSYAYAAHYGRLYIADISAPDSPQFIYNTLNDSHGVDARGDRLFTAGYESDLRIYDVTYPPAPIVIGSLALPDNSYYVTVDGHYAYLSAERRFHIVDISDEANPMLVSTLPIPNNAWKAVIKDEYAYLASSGSGLLIVSIADHANPEIVGTFGRTEPTGAIALREPYIYLSAFGDGVAIIDVADPSDPVLVGSIPTFPADGSVYSVTVIETLAYVHCFPDDGAPSVRVYDITNPVAAASIGGISPGGPVVDAGGFACVGAPMELRTLATANPASPPILGGINLGSGAADDVYLGESHAYAAAWSNGLVVIDFSVPESPVIAGSYDTPGEAQGVVVQDDLAYVADGPSGLAIIDVSSPATPTLVGSLDTFDAKGVVVSGPYAYIADGWGQFKVVQVSDPTAPVLVGTSVGIPYVAAVEIFGPYVVASEVYEGRLCVMDVSVPSQPHVAGFLYAAGLRDFAVNGPILYAADQNEGLRVYDLTDPLHPTLVRTLPTPDLPDGVSLDGQTLYIAGGYMGIQAYDVVDPFAPRLIGSADTPGRSRRVDVGGDYAFVTHQIYGLKILPAHCVDPAGVSGNVWDGASSSLLVYPNPVTGAIRLSFVLPIGSTVELAIFDAGGRLIQDLTGGWSGPGEHRVVWEGRDDAGRRVSSGVYQARLRYGGHSERRTFVLLR